jgi:hypothetical protein
MEQNKIHFLLLVLLQMLLIFEISCGSGIKVADLYGSQHVIILNVFFSLG